MKITAITKLVIIGLLILAVPTAITAQPAPVRYHKEAFILESGEYAGLTGSAARSFVAFRQTVRLPEAPWLQLHFGEYNLGKQSYITVTSLKDGHKQSLDAKKLLQWQDSTAYFNGDAVEVELHVAPGEKGVFVRIEEITVGERASGDQKSFQQESICITTDDRVASNDPAVGRIVPVGCTGWIASNGSHLTAGQCVGDGMQIMQFNVPASNPDGTINHPAPQHQYPIIASSIRFDSRGVGRDWAIFKCGPNANTGLLPAHAQGAFLRMFPNIARDGILRITGYGVDGPGPPNGNFGNSQPRNADNQTQQTDIGLFASFSGLEEDNLGIIHHGITTQPGNAGSPIIMSSGTVTGIHTNHCGSGGTSFGNVALIIAMDEFIGTNVRFVDQGHPAAGENREEFAGDIYIPHVNVTSAVNRASRGQILSIAAGNYPEALTITKPLTLTAPVGPVIIGN